jgi:hypothetical protein
MAPAARAALTVTLAVFVAVVPRESATLTQYVVVEAGVAVYVLVEPDWRAVPVHELPE